MAEMDEFDVFVDACREIGLTDIKSLEAALDQHFPILPGAGWTKEFRETFFNLLKRGAEYARFEDQIKNGGA